MAPRLATGSILTAGVAGITAKGKHMLNITIARSSGRVVPRTVGPVFLHTSTSGTQLVFRPTLLSRLASTGISLLARDSKLEPGVASQAGKVGNQ